MLMVPVRMRALDAASRKEDASEAACRFCRHLSHETPPSADWTPVYETERFVAVPSIGALVPGWLLVLPTSHALNLAQLGQGVEEEIESIARQWEELVGPVTWFEHGPHAPGSAVGCSIDHAHMHLVPLGGFDLLSGIRDLVPDLAFEGVPGLVSAQAAIESGESYLYLRTPHFGSSLARSQNIPSQAFRRVIAAHQGRPSEYDWDAFRRYDVVAQTIDIASRAL